MSELIIAKNFPFFPIYFKKYSKKLADDTLGSKIFDFPLGLEKKLERFVTLKSQII
jgi:hypothetical protein